MIDIVIGASISTTEVADIIVGWLLLTVPTLWTIHTIITDGKTS